MSWKKMIFGEKMPDKDDPKYKERYEREVAAGRKAARLLRLEGACNASPASTPSGFSPLCSALC